jgi:hypothetical protein
LGESPEDCQNRQGEKYAINVVAEGINILKI